MTRFGLRALWGLVGLWLLSLFGCATAGIGSPAPRTGQEQAVWLVWHAAYHREDMPPLVRWVEGAALTCTDEESGKPGFRIPRASIEPPPLIQTPTSQAPDFTLGTECREGFTWSPLEVLVAWHGEPSFSETALAHELLHAVLLREGQWGDHHARKDFQPRIDAANELLRSAGR